MDRRELTEYDCEQLRKMKGKQIIVNIESVSASGMTRKMNFFFVNEERKIENITSQIAKMTESGRDKNGCMIVKGCGMDMVFAVLYDFNCAMIKLEELEGTGISHSERCKFWVDSNNYQLL